MLYDKIRSECYDSSSNLVYYGLLAERMLSIIKTYATNVDNILDICCGTGQLTGKLRQKYQKSNIIGLDISQDMIDIASKKYPDILFVNQDANSILLDQRFDLITSNFGVQWLNASFADKFVDLCNPHAKIIFSIPNYGEGTTNNLAYSFVGNRLFQIILRLSKLKDFHEIDIVRRIVSVWKGQLKATEIIYAFSKNKFTQIDTIDACDFIEYENAEEMLDSLIARGMFGNVLDNISFHAKELLLEEIEKEEKKYGNLKEEIISKWFVFEFSKLRSDLYE